MHRALALLPALFLTACATATVAVRSDFDFGHVNRVAVVSFTDYPGRPGSGAVVAGAFEQGLLAAGYDVVERASVDKLLQERRLTAVDAKTARELGKLLGVDALLLGRVTDLAEPREAMIKTDVVEERGDPYRPHRRRSVVVRREPRLVTVAGRLGASARLVYVPTGEVLWSGSDVERTASITDSARSLADAILGSVKKTWPASRKP